MDAVARALTLHAHARRQAKCACSRWRWTCPAYPAELTFPPKYGEHTAAILAEAGFSAADCTSLKEQGIIAG
jgi:crotonobetainyl-CoA:carnitine CoA-transferase CaiB-like acyl-CoA transferase